jgi:hypothetical protein
MIEATIGEIKSNADVSGACRQLSIALAVLERVIVVLGSPRARAPFESAQVGSGSSASLSDAAGVIPNYQPQDLELEEQRSGLQATSVSTGPVVNMPESNDSTPSLSGSLNQHGDADSESTGACADGSAATLQVVAALDYRLTGLIFSSKAFAAYAEGRGLPLTSDVCFVDPSKIHICLSG